MTPLLPSFTATLEDVTQTCNAGLPATGPQDEDPVKMAVRAVCEAIVNIDRQMARLGMIVVSPGAYGLYTQQKSDLGLLKHRLISSGKLLFPMSEQFTAMVNNQKDDAS